MTSKRDGCSAAGKFLRPGEESALNNEAKSSFRLFDPVGRLSLKRRHALGLIASAAVGAPFLAGCGGFWPVCTFNYKLLVVASVEGVLREGFSIIEVSLYDRGALGHPDTDRIIVRSRGEAVVIDVGKSEPLFGLLRHPPTMSGFSASVPHRVLLKFTGMRGTAIPDFEQLPLIPELQGEFALAAEDTPTLVRFRDLNDPRSVELVTPPHFAQIYGSSARFERSTIAVTSEPRTAGVLAKWLPWLGSLGEKSLMGAYTVSADGPLAGQLTRSNFEIRG